MTALSSDNELALASLYTIHCNQCPAFYFHILVLEIMRFPVTPVTYAVTGARHKPYNSKKTDGKDVATGNRATGGHVSSGK